MKTYQVALFGGLGILVATAILPQTSWIFKNQVDLLSNGWQLNGVVVGDGDPNAVFPEHIMRPATWSGTGRAELAKWLNPIPGSDSFDIRTARIRAYCESHRGEVGAWAQLVRTLSITAALPSEHPQPPDSKHEAYLRELVKACDQAARLDSDNVFFPFTKATALYRLGDEPGSFQALHQAGEATKYDDYTNYAVETFRQALNDTYGYRGNLVGTQILAMITFPHFATYRAFVKRVAQEARAKKDFATLDALLSVGRHMVLQTDSVIGVFVARTVLAVTVRSDIPIGTKQRTTDLLPDALRFDQERGSGTSGQEAARMFNAFSPVLQQRSWMNDTSLTPFMSLRTAYGGAILVALVALPALLALGVRLKNLQNLCWLSAIPLAVAIPRFEGLAVCAVMATIALAALSFFPKAKNIREALFLLVLIATLALCFWDVRVSFVAASGLLAFGSSKLDKPLWQTLSVVAGTFQVAAAFVGVLLLRNQLDSALFQAVIALLAAASFAKVSKEDLWRVGGTAVAFLAVCYLGTVAWELRADRQLSALNTAFTNEADILRQKARL